MSVTTDKIASNGKKFTRSDYNGISIIIRDKDGFINDTLNQLYDSSSVDIQEKIREILKELDKCL